MRFHGVPSTIGVVSHVCIIKVGHTLLLRLVNLDFVEWELRIHTEGSEGGDKKVGGWPVHGCTR